jgi:hypothetical protein
VKETWGIALEQCDKVVQHYGQKKMSWSKALTCGYSCLLLEPGVTSSCNCASVPTAYRESNKTGPAHRVCLLSLQTLPCRPWKSWCWQSSRQSPDPGPGPNRHQEGPREEAPVSLIHHHQPQLVVETVARGRREMTMAGAEGNHGL